MKWANIFYYADVDANGVLCVDQLDAGSREFSPEQVAKMADSYPETIYFLYEKDAVSGNDQTCKHCGRSIIEIDGTWIDPAATGDDLPWRETCDEHDTFIAEHEPRLS